MPTPNRGYATPATGSEVDTWGDVINANAAIIDKNFGALAAITLSNTNVTLTTDQAQNGTITLLGAISTNITVFFPAVSGWWKVVNLCTGNFYVAVANTSGSNQIGIPPGEAMDVFTDGTSFRHCNLYVPIGGYVSFATSTIPGWITACTVPPFLSCEGATFSQATYPYLSFFLGGTTLPDTRGRSLAYLNAGTSRITTGGSGIDGNTLFSGGGAESITLDTTQIPSHTHGVTDPGHRHIQKVTSAPGGDLLPQFTTGGGSQNSATSTDFASTGITINNTGGGLAHRNMGPTLIAGIVMIRAA